MLRKLALTSVQELTNDVSYLVPSPGVGLRADRNAQDIEWRARFLHVLIVLRFVLL